MFWKIMRWGGTGIVMLLVLGAGVLAPGAADMAAPAAPSEAAPANKHFNF